ncbi:MAG: flagellar basal body-associated FliL family protein [Nitrospirae bacterium]|nr:flagellar basal body-associated FliL family protein [Nitrospirota bacterium]
MADEEPQAEAEAAAAAGPGVGAKIRKIVIIAVSAVVGLAVVVGGGFFAYKKMLSQKANPEDVIQEIGPTFKLENIIANLGDESGDRFVKLTLELEMSDGLLQPELEKRLPQIKQIIQLTLRSKKAAELNTPTGMSLFAEEILHQINSVLTGEKTVRHVYVPELAIQ